MLRRGAEADPLVAEAGFDAQIDHRIQHFVLALIADAMEKIAARTHLLQRHQVAAFMVHGGKAIFDELLGDEGKTFPVALQLLRGAVGRAGADLGEDAAGAVGNAPVQLALGILVIGAAEGIGRVLGDPRHLQGLAVVIGGVAAAMMHGHGMVGRDLVKIVNIDLAIVLDFRVVEEIALDPGARQVSWRRGP